MPSLDNTGGASSTGAPAARLGARAGARVASPRRRRRRQERDAAPAARRRRRARARAVAVKPSRGPASVAPGCRSALMQVAARSEDGATAQRSQQALDLSGSNAVASRPRRRAAFEPFRPLQSRAVRRGRRRVPRRRKLARDGGGPLPARARARGPRLWQRLGKGSARGSAAQVLTLAVSSPSRQHLAQRARRRARCSQRTLRPAWHGCRGRPQRG
jgi:hypothetical protein